MTLVTALPDALVALWLALLAGGMRAGHPGAVVVAGLGLGVSAPATWWLRVVLDRLQRRFRDRIAVVLEAHVARLQASVATIEHHERHEYLDRLAILRNQVFALDHLFLSLFATVGWIMRLGITVALLVWVRPVLGLLVIFALPPVLTASWRPGRERAVEEGATAASRLARHLFALGTTAPPGKEIRVARLTGELAARRRAAFEAWYRPVARARWVSACWHALGWATFGTAYVGAIALVATGRDPSPGAILLVLAAGGRLFHYVGAAVGEVAFLRGLWLDSSRRLAWLEDFAAAHEARAIHPAPARLTHGIRFEQVSFRYPGTERLVLDDVTVELPAGAVVAVVGENGAGKTTLVKLLARMYEPTAGRITVDGVDLGTIAAGDWRSRLGGAFQDFFRFELLAQQAVGVGDLERMAHRPAVEAAVERAGAADVVAGLPAGLDTQLGVTWEEGVEVSFGQWQKIALARGFMRAAPLVLLLDEPTAALDAETEHALFERYAQASRGMAASGRVTVLVSHRFSTVRMADLIIVLDGAHVIEVGPHETLVARGGRYAELYAIQADAYR